MYKDNFLSSLSSQIRTPLNGIIGYSQLLSQTRLDKTQQSYVNSVNSCSLQLVGIINDILDFCKLSDGKAVVRNECFSISEICDEVSSTMDSHIRDRRQKLYFVVEKNIPDYIVSDRQKIIQILINLISNSNKFSPIDSRIIVNISSQSEQKLKFTVDDNGIGISEEECKRLFTPFLKLEDSLLKNGSGLGLVICKKLVELLGGEIYVQSSKGSGSTFSFTITFESYEEFKKIVERNTSILRDKIVLVIDNDTDTRIGISEILFDSGIKPVTISSSIEAYKILESKRYDFSCVLLSVYMPEISGSKLVKQIREISPELPIIALSPANGSFEYTDFNKVIHKPVNRVKLVDAIYKLVSKDDITTSQLNEVQQSIHSKKADISILIAEDICYNLDMLVKMLDTMGYKNIHTATDGEQAISKLSKNTYDILLLDLKISLKDGFEIAQYIRDSGKNINIAVLSASVLHSDRERCKALGIKYFLLKPFGMTNLKIMMNRLINGTK
jgi:CheY-like chemotaxis protein